MEGMLMHLAQKSSRNFVSSKAHTLESLPHNHLQAGIELLDS